jgi:alpha-ketoglutarate-dependent taurine dioxygenase
MICHKTKAVTTFPGFSSFFFILRLTLLYCLLIVTVLGRDIIVEPIAGSSLGAEIKERGSPLPVHLPSLDEASFKSIHDALIDHKVLVIRNQSSLSVEDFRAFSQRFGTLRIHIDGSSHLPGYSDVNVVSNIKNTTGQHIGLHGEHVETFHSDLSWHHIPVKITALLSVIRPQGCGDTHFSWIPRLHSMISMTPSRPDSLVCTVSTPI